MSLCDEIKINYLASQNKYTISEGNAPYLGHCRALCWTKLVLSVSNRTSCPEIEYIGTTLQEDTEEIGPRCKT